MTEASDWRTALRNQYMSSGRPWTLSEDVQDFILSKTELRVLRAEKARQAARGGAYSDSEWRRPEYRQWYLAYYTTKYLSHLQRILLANWPSDSFDMGITVLDVGVGPGTTALAMMDLCNTAEKLGILQTNGHPRFLAIDRDEDKIDYAHQCVHAFAETCEARHGRALSWARAFADGGNWFELDLCNEPAVRQWAQPRSIDVVVASNTYTELVRQGPAARNFTHEFVPRALRRGGLVVLLEPCPPRNWHEYKTNLCDAASALSESLGSAKRTPCPEAAATACDCRRSPTGCEEQYEWALPRVLSQLYRPGEWDVNTLWATVTRA